MTEGTITLPNGTTLGFGQAIALTECCKKLHAEGGHVHWHKNECGCCLTVHGHARAVVIDREGGQTWFDHRGCDCADDVQGQTT